MNKEVTTYEDILFRQVGLVVLKPDTIEYVLENYYIKDFHHLGLDTKYRQIIHLSETDVHNIYPELVPNQDIFPVIVEYMTSGPSMIVLLKPSFDIGESEADTVQSYIRKNKGHADEIGLRRKYIHIFEDDLKKLYPNKKQFLLELSKNRIHAPDDVTHVIQTLIYLWPKMDHNKIAETWPELYNNMKNRFSIQPYVTI